ncbi:hypothetical protein V9K67_25305 [Paraflavisolibacter sp. H34]|uniref:hypothetical protein n=1 Tax=Huijunlia imazamoxiresistens TaxID=3127457 RepID=UPI003015ED0B
MNLLFVLIQAPVRDIYDVINACSGAAAVATLFILLYKEYTTREQVNDLSVIVTELSRQNELLIKQLRASSNATWRIKEIRNHPNHGVTFITIENTGKQVTITSVNTESLNLTIFVTDSDISYKSTPRKILQLQHICSNESTIFYACRIKEEVNERIKTQAETEANEEYEKIKGYVWENQEPPTEWDIYEPLFEKYLSESFDKSDYKIMLEYFDANDFQYQLIISGKGGNTPALTVAY